MKSYDMLKTKDIEIAIDAGFSERIDCEGNPFLWHRAGIVIQGNEPTWLFLRKLEIANTYEILEENPKLNK